MVFLSGDWGSGYSRWRRLRQRHPLGIGHLPKADPGRYWRHKERRRISNREVVTAMFLILFIVLLLAWVLGFLAFHVAGGLIHLLLIVAVISLIVHFMRGRSAA
jgi:hypothetical protein